MVPFELRAILCVAIGSMAGGVARYCISILLRSLQLLMLPWGTLAVNVGGCFLAGLIFGLLGTSGQPYASLRLLLTTGFCGGFTTFSTFIHENYMMMETRQFATMALYAALSLLLGFLAAVGGHCLAKIF